MEVEKIIDEDLVQKNRYLEQERNISGPENKIQEALGQMEYFVRLAELNALKLRNEFLELSNENDGWEIKTQNWKQKIEDFEKELFDIDFKISGNVFIMRFPRLMPHRKEKPDIIFYGSVYEGLKKFVLQNKIELLRFQEKIEEGAVLVFHHNYMDKFMIRDNDNIEIKFLIDALVVNQIIKSDRGNYLNIFHMADYNNDFHENTSELMVMSKKQFQQYILSSRDFK